MNYVAIVEASIAEMSEEDRVLWMRFTACATVVCWSDQTQWSLGDGNWIDVHHQLVDGGFWPVCFCFHDSVYCTKKAYIGPAIIALLREHWLPQLKMKPQ